MTASPQKASAAAGPLPHHPRSGKKSSSEMPVQKCQTLSPSAEELSATKIQTTAERFSSTIPLSSPGRSEGDGSQEANRRAGSAAADGSARRNPRFSL